MIFRRNKLAENIGKGWDSNPDIPLQNPVALSTVPWEPLQWNFCKV